MIISNINVFWIGVFFLGLFLSGFWLHRRGKPYGAMLFNLHKFIGLGAAIFLGVAVYQVNRQAPFTALEITAVVITAAFFAINIVSGGLLNTNLPRQKALVTIHHVMPYLTVFATAIMFYFLYR